MKEEPVYVTAEGKLELERELERLKTVIWPDLAEKLKEAVSMGDLKENADYHDTREKMSLAQGRIQQLEAMLRNVVLIDANASTDEVRLGTKVTIRDEDTKEDETYIIVGPTEANPSNGRISEKSPIGAALLGKKKNAKVEVNTPDGAVRFKIIKIEKA